MHTNKKSLPETGEPEPPRNKIVLIILTRKMVPPKLADLSTSHQLVGSCSPSGAGHTQNHNVGFPYSCLQPVWGLGLRVYGSGLGFMVWSWSFGFKGIAAALLLSQRQTRQQRATTSARSPSQIPNPKPSTPNPSTPNPKP